MEKIAKRYLKWLLWVDSRTLGYLIREELQREKMREMAERRAWEFERRLEEGKGEN